MRIRVDDATARRELADALGAAGCVALAIGQTLELDRAGTSHTPAELLFFLRAWQAQHPHVRLRPVA